MNALVWFVTIPLRSLQRGRLGRRSILLFAILVWLGIAGGDANALQRGLSLSLAPTIDYVLWDSDLGLRDASMYGGRLSLNFGRIVSLQGHYLTNDKVHTDLGAIHYDGEPIGFSNNQELRVNRYGADLLFNLGLDQSFAPFIRIGGGVIQFQPKENRNFDVIALSAGAGLRFALIGRLHVQLYAEDLMFRMDRQMLVPDAESTQNPPPMDPDRNDIRHNVAFGGNIILNLGGHSSDQETALDRAIRSRYDGGLFGGSWLVEPYVGRVKFDSHAGLDDQPFAGVRTGFNFGQLIGLRGYYWRGMNDHFDDTDPVQSYGGEAQFNLNTGQGAIPYLLLGAGQLDFLKDYYDESNLTRSDKTMLIVGGGLGFTLGRHIRVNAGARDYIFSESDPEALAEPGELLHNFAYSAGLTFLFGGKQSSRADVDAFGRERYTPASTPSRQGELPPVPEGTTPVAAPEPSGWADMPPDRTSGRTTEYLVLPDSLMAVRTYQGDRIVAIPVPEVGEIYIRYGEPGGVKITSEYYPQQPAETAAAMAMPDSVPPIISSSVLSDDERMELLSRRLEERLGDRLEKRIDECLKTLAPSTEGPAPQSVVVNAPSTAAAGAESAGTAGEKTADRKIFHTYAGVNIDAPSQFVLGARLDVGSIANNKSLRFVPELAFGFFNTGSVLLVGNAMYNFGPLPGTDQIAPYVFGGLGLIRFGEGLDRDRTEGVLNLGYGITKPIGNWIGFIEHQGIDLFNLNRINAGIRWVRN
jgi:hypothetical protein